MRRAYWFTLVTARPPFFTKYKNIKQHSLVMSKLNFCRRNLFLKIRENVKIFDVLNINSNPILFRLNKIKLLVLYYISL